MTRPAETATGPVTPAAAKAAALVPGARFDTPFEAGCVVFSRPDEDGDFLAYDSDNVLCGFAVAMVERVLGVAEPAVRVVYRGGGYGYFVTGDGVIAGVPQRVTLAGPFTTAAAAIAERDRITS